jgi:hypothetical protein
VQEEINKLLGDKLSAWNRLVEIKPDGRTIQLSSSIRRRERRPGVASPVRPAWAGWWNGRSATGRRPTRRGRRSGKRPRRPILVDDRDAAGRHHDKAKLAALFDEARRSSPTARSGAAGVFDPQLAADVRTRAFYAILLSQRHPLYLVPVRLVDVRPRPYVPDPRSVLHLGIIAGCYYVHANITRRRRYKSNRSRSISPRWPPCSHW